MKRILGLDLGTNSIGWALVNEATEEHENSSIVKLGVRVNPLTIDEKTNFEKGRPFSVNADRTLKRGARRNLQRFKQRRKNLLEILEKYHIISDSFVLAEEGKGSTYGILNLRAKAAVEKVSLEELAKVFFTINKKRGYKSSRKAKNEEDGNAIDGMAIAKELYETQTTPGAYVFNLLVKANKKNRKVAIPDFYRSDLQNEFDKVWNYQKQFYPDVLDEELYKAIENQGQQNSRKRFLAIKGIYTAENKGKREAIKLQHYKWRTLAVNEQLTIEEVAYVLVEINNNLNKSSGYLGAISDRSKELYFNKETVGQNLWKQIQKNRHTSLKNQVFYRQDYLDEFEVIWETQSQFYPEILTASLKEEIRDVVIFYQRKLKSQKGLLGFCQFESWQIDKTDKEGNILLNKLTANPKKVTIGNRVIAKSSPLFQEFKVWQNLNNLEFKRKDEAKKDLFNQNVVEEYVLNEETRLALFKELNIRGSLTEKDILAALGLKTKEWKTNFSKGLEGNRTNEALFKVYRTIAQTEGYGEDWENKLADEIIEELTAVFTEIGVSTNILDFDATKESATFDKQEAYQLWHLLYATEDDEKVSKKDQEIYGNSLVNLKKKLHLKYGFKPEYAKWMANVALQDDYGNLSSKAIRNIIPHLQAGNNYYEACALAGYNHSNSETKEEKENKVLLDKLDLLPKNSLRNPVVEKILNQMVNLINQVIKTYGKPDEVRIELARELKKSIAERKEMTANINDATKRNDKIKAQITKEFGIPNPTKTDVVRFRLWEELAVNGYKDVFTNVKIPKEKIFSKEIDIEHIVPKALLFDDSFSNKTLAFRKINLQKGARTAFDFIQADYQNDLDQYTERVEALYAKGKGISKSKYKKLLISRANLPEGFIERDLRNSQYIAKKAKAMLQEVFKDVVATSGSITNKLREDWGIVNVMKELNMPKYKALGLTEIQQRLDKGTEELKEVEVIKDWTKRNDHRHHAMDALTVAFTTHNHIQYINNLNTIASVKENDPDLEKSRLFQLKNTITKVYDLGNGKKKRKFIPPMLSFRKEAKTHIESILISFKNKNKVVTKNINKTKVKGGYLKKEQLTPRGQLHKETVYGKSKRIAKKPLKLTKSVTLKQLQLIVDKPIREVVVAHIALFDGNIAVAFDAKSLKKQPLLYKGETLKEVKVFEEIFTIRKDINTENFKNEKALDKVIDLKTKQVLHNRLKEYNGNAKEAFSNLEKHPIWLNKEKGIAIKRVTISGVANAEALHYKKDHLGNAILDNKGKKQAVDFVSTGNNHHVAIYKDAKGKLQEKVVSFYEAVARANQKLSIVNKEFNKELGWEFLFSMKQNEMFVFRSEDFNPKEIDLLDVKNAYTISKHLYRVQKIASKNYMFRFHLETLLNDAKEVKDMLYINLRSTEKLEDLIKVRINHIGQIVSVGEY